MIKNRNFSEKNFSFQFFCVFLCRFVSCRVVSFFRHMCHFVSYWFDTTHLDSLVITIVYLIFCIDLISGQSTKPGQRPKAVDGHRYFIQCNGSPPCYDIRTLSVFASPPPLQNLFLAPKAGRHSKENSDFDMEKKCYSVMCESVYFSCHDHKLLVRTKKSFFFLYLSFKIIGWVFERGR